MIRNIGLGAEAWLFAAADVQRPRDVNPAHFVTDGELPRGSHVLLIDDTWTSGGHAQLVIALHRAGAAWVSLLVVARWIKEDFANNANFLRGLADRDYNPAICPWTGGVCP